MSKGLFDCKCCKRPVVLHPPLSKRIGADGPMTRAEAMSIFHDNKGGMCSTCYVKSRNEQPLPAPILQNLTLEGLRDHARGYRINGQIERIPFRAVARWEPVVV